MPDIFYSRTAEGQAAAYDATSAMPRKLKSLLKVIDGKTSQAVFANSLKAFGDVQGLLVSLQKAGLIELRQSVVDTQPLQAPAPATSESTQESLASALASKIGLRPSRSKIADDGFPLTQSVHTQPRTILESRSHSIDKQQERQQDLQLLVQDMSSFVLAYAPEQAFSVLSELESTSSMEQLAVLLGGYELMIRHTGEPAQIHLNHVRQILGKWL